jgi:hypothetical protein
MSLAGHSFTDGTPGGTWADVSAEAQRPTALVALLALAGTASHDAALHRTSDGDLTMYRETLDMLTRPEAAPSA